MENGQHLKARLTCSFKAVRKGQLNAEENEEVTILSVEDGYATCQKACKSGQVIGQLPTYFLEMVECPGDTFADQISYRRLWHAIVDGEKTEMKMPEMRQRYSNNADRFVRELAQVPALASFAQVLPNIGPLVGALNSWENALLCNSQY